MYVAVTVSLLLTLIIHAQHWLSEHDDGTDLTEPPISQYNAEDGDDFKHLSTDMIEDTAGDIGEPSSARRVRINTTGLRVLEDEDWPVWMLETGISSTSVIINGVTTTLSVSDGVVLDGSRYKFA
ncbi:hypothetical protein F5X99DRAFT_404106 [Biscogniauxia marginata]|nr:hypothetical protein F5X99DRAFT_404106 [Biscogniauxia marginata]